MTLGKNSRRQNLFYKLLVERRLMLALITPLISCSSALESPLKKERTLQILMKYDVGVEMRQILFSPYESFLAVSTTKESLNIGKTIVFINIMSRQRNQIEKKDRINDYTLYIPAVGAYSFAFTSPRTIFAPDLDLTESRILRMQVTPGGTDGLEISSVKRVEIFDSRGVEIEAPDLVVQGINNNIYVARSGSPCVRILNSINQESEEPINSSWDLCGNANSPSSARRIDRLVASKNSNFLAIAYHDPTLNNKEIIEIYNSESGRSIVKFRANGSVSDLDFTEDGLSWQIQRPTSVTWGDWPHWNDVPLDTARITFVRESDFLKGFTESASVRQNDWVYPLFSICQKSGLGLNVLIKSLENISEKLSKDYKLSKPVAISSQKYMVAGNIDRQIVLYKIPTKLCLESL